ncbi:hypothetical protein L9W80_18660 [Vibrio aestuarianus]|uniref:hypothetical protein n=1 Tax=Vibrio aestuarianus TaxID=28171 RepID=UPI00237CDD7F|nr:hypothetical protein [Vibrio aestuarianus]MDE1352160.1 hypothetical protein [Vibrio aestuarianus]
MPDILKTVHCPTCKSEAHVRQRRGKYKQLDLKCPQCGVLNYQTHHGQALLSGLPEIIKPDSRQDVKPDNKPEYSGKTTNTFFE